MIAKFKLLPLLLLSFLGCGVALASPAPGAVDPGQRGSYNGNNGQTITCSSDDGKRHYCNIDTRGGVRLSRQISGSACDQGRGWGYDNRGVWVDRGCRAEFVSGRGNGGGSGWGGGNNGNNGNNGQTITCSSDDGKRHYCNIDTRGGVRLSRQISGSACQQGRSWGYDNRGVWVDRGCRAEFVSGNGRR